MAHILILGGGAAGLAAALAAAQAAPAARLTVLERNPKVGKKLLATGNGRCNLDNTAIAPEKYFTADPAALRPLLAAVDAAAPLAWFEQLGLYTRTDEAGRVYPYSNQAADVLALLELHLQRHTVQLRTGLAKLPHVKNISGIGLMVGIEFYDLKAADVLAACREAGLLVLTAKTRLRLLPPLTLSEHDVDMALEILSDVLGKMEPTAPKEQA